MAVKVTIALDGSIYVVTLKLKMCNFKVHLALELCLIVGAHAWGIKVMTYYSLFGIVMELYLS